MGDQSGYGYIDSLGESAKINNFLARGAFIPPEELQKNPLWCCSFGASACHEQERLEKGDGMWIFEYA
jgi:hypothetical protein